MIPRVLLASLAVIAIALSANAQERKRIERADDLPRFSYPVSGNLEEYVRDEKKFAALAGPIRRDLESVLASHDIADKAAQRRLLGVLGQLDWLEGKYDDASKRSEQIRALQEKPSDKLLSGLLTRAMLAARKTAGGDASEAYRSAVAANMLAELRSMPFETIANDIKGAKGSFESLGEALVLGGIREVLQPSADKTGALSSDLAPRVVSARYVLQVLIPHKRIIVDTYAAYLNANKIDKPDIWAARDVQLPAGRNYAPVPIAVWDSGVDSKLFAKQVVRESDGSPATIGFDLRGNPANVELYPIPTELQSRLPKMRSRTKGLSDLRSNVDSPEASEIKQYLSELKPAEYKAAMEELSLASQYNHGTHVAGIAMAGNPYAQLVIARLTFDHKLLPDPCPSKEQSEKDARNAQSYVDFMKKHGVRVVNMSWGTQLREVERTLEVCGIGKTTAERKVLARELFEIEKTALVKALQSAPGIVFVASSGNSNQDATFAESFPSGLVLPNLITVGAVDKAGDEANFTSYGPTVVVHANGYQVESYIPGGDRVALSGTSMSAPQVTNLAAKLLAVNPKLKAQEAIAIIRETAEKTPDGRRILMHPARAIAAAEKRAA